MGIRRIADSPPTLVPIQRLAGASRTIEVTIEPYLLGGGATPRQNDPVQLVRPTSILGQLRFFWRLVTPAATLAELRTREAALFGSDSEPAKFSLSVEVTAPGALEREPPGINARGGYLLFSARGETRRGTPPAELRRGVSARVTLAPVQGALPDDVNRAFDLWLMLGGVGARTRRGVGAPQTAGYASLAVFQALLKARLAEAPSEPKTESGAVRSIRRVWVSTGQFPTALDCFNELNDWYKFYRQDRRPGNPRPGRSYWQEPDLIRKLTGQSEDHHRTPSYDKQRHPAGFARAALGLPIVTVFAPGDRRDPGQTTLEAAASGRFASPLLFRPVRIGQQYRAVVVLLSGPYSPPGGLELIQGKTRHEAALTSDPERVFRDLVQFAAKGGLGQLQLIHGPG